MAFPLVYIIIISYNNIDDTIETINSFLRQKYENFKIIISDNNRDEHSYNLLKKMFPALTFFHNPENPGWAKANNDAIAYAIHSDADYLILANNDIFIEETDTLTLMIEAAEGFKMLHHDFLMGAKINSYYHRDQVLSRGLLFFPFKHSYKQSSLRKKKDLEFFNKKISYIDYPEGSFLLISKGVFSTIGFFDEKMHLYGEERDFAFRAWKQGIPSVNNNSITIFHKLSRSTIHNSSLKLYYYYRNFYYFIKKHKKNISRHSCLSWSFFLVNIKTMGSVIMHPSKYPDSTLKTLIALHWSILDGFIFTRMGKKHYQ